MNWFKKFFSKKQQQKRNLSKDNVITNTKDSKFDYKKHIEEDLVESKNILSPMNPLSPFWWIGSSNNHEYNSTNDNNNYYDTSSSWSNNDTSNHDSGSSYDSWSNSSTDTSSYDSGSSYDSSSSSFD